MFDSDTDGGVIFKELMIKAIYYDMAVDTELRYFMNVFFFSFKFTGF